MIAPDSLIQIWHSHMHNESTKNRFRVVGKMPEDFHPKLVAAIKASITLEPKNVSASKRLL